MMYAQVIHQAGGADVFSYEKRPIPTLKAGWSLIKIKGFGINHSEIFTREGLSPSVSFPRILGIECVGEVVETTSHHLTVGQRVMSLMGEMGRAFDGSYAEYVLLPNPQIYPVHCSLDWRDLAAVPETYYTAFGSLTALKLSKAKSVLVRAAASGVGVAFAKLVKAAYPNIVLTGSVRTFTKKEQLLAVGYDQVILDKAGQLQTAGHYDRVLELVGPATLKDSLIHAAPNSIICSVGQLGGKWYLEDFDPIMALQQNRYLTTFYSGDVSQELLDDLFAYIERYQVDVRPDKTFKLQELPEAHCFLEGKHSFGKVVVLND